MSSAGGEGRQTQSLNEMDRGEVKIERQTAKGWGENGAGQRSPQLNETSTLTRLDHVIDQALVIGTPPNVIKHCCVYFSIKVQHSFLPVTIHLLKFHHLVSEKFRPASSLHPAARVGVWSL